MRWLLLLLLVLNAFYFVWHRQQAPMVALEADEIVEYQPVQKDIQLLSEAPEKVARKGVEPAPVLEASMCLFFGGFGSHEEAENMRQRLAGLDIGSVVGERASVSGVDYWVYLPPLASRGASLRQLKELQARQIDSFVIADGDLANGISLGIFPRYESASSVMARLSAAGYEPLLRKLSRSERSFWVRVDPGRDRLIDDDLLAGLASGFEGLRHEVRSCEFAEMEQPVE